MSGENPECCIQGHDNELYVYECQAYDGQDKPPEHYEQGQVHIDGPNKEDQQSWHPHLTGLSQW